MTVSSFKVGRFTFYECSVSFHYKRDNVYSPWETIGVYLSNPKYCGVRYREEYRHIQAEYRLELKKPSNEYIKSTPEFLEFWGSRFKSPTECLSPVINYCTTYTGEFKDILNVMFGKYVGNNSSAPFLMMSLMIKMKRAFFPSIFNSKNMDRFEMIKDLKNGGYLDYT